MKLFLPAYVQNLLADKLLEHGRTQMLPYAIYKNTSDNHCD